VVASNLVSSMSRWRTSLTWLTKVRTFSSTALASVFTVRTPLPVSLSESVSPVTTSEIVLLAREIQALDRGQPLILSWASWLAWVVLKAAVPKPGSVLLDAMLSEAAWPVSRPRIWR